MSPRPTPALNGLAVSVAAPAVLLSRPDGQILPGGAQGWFVDDVRLLDRSIIEVQGSDLELVRSDIGRADRTAFTYVARSLGGWAHDPTVTLERRRWLRPAGLEEEIVVASRSPEPVELRLTVDLSSDLAPLGVVRGGGAAAPVRPECTEDSLVWRREGAGVSVRLDPVPASVSGAGRVTWSATLAPGTSHTLRLTFAAEGAPAFGPAASVPWSAPAGVLAPDVRLSRLTERSLADLAGLLLRDGDDVFAAAGSPWFLTLFGRDALWTARLMMPFTTGLALSTLRVLGRRQGTVTDRDSEEQPGKILHEVRSTTLDLGGLSLPPAYYGTIDATPLFVCTLVDAWRWGAEPGAVAELLPAVRRCLEWMLEQSRETGWLRYVDVSGHGLANQGWKDSVDSVQFADGGLAEPPIALCEVQGYAHEAAVRGAQLLAAFGEEPVAGLADWAADLRDRFRRDFWVDTPEGGHVAIALDASGRRVDSVTSNLGHLLGTGILDRAQVERVCVVLAGPDLDSGFGLRTLSADSPRFSRLSYHGGSVWPHDTAVAVLGLAREARTEQAARLTAGLVAAAEGVGYRLPELYGGDSADDVPFPTDYPAACRPQAWAAAAPLACLVAVTGLEVDVPAGRVEAPPRTTSLLGPFTVRGLRAGEREVEVAVGATGRVSLS